MPHQLKQQNKFALKYIDEMVTSADKGQIKLDRPVINWYILTVHGVPEATLRLKKYTKNETCFIRFLDVSGFHFGQNKNLCRCGFFLNSDNLQTRF